MLFGRFVRRQIQAPHSTQDRSGDVRQKRAVAVVAAVVLTLLGSLPVHAQIKRSTIRFNRLTQHDGLSNNVIQTLLQDKQGFLWVGTVDGLNRYDGYEFQTFVHDPANPHSLGDNSVITMALAPDSTIWIGSFLGLNSFDPRTHTFRRYSHDAEDPNSLSHNTVNSLSFAPDGTLWIGTFGGGLNRFDPKSGSWTHFRHDPSQINTISSDLVNAVAVDKEGNVWAGTADAGLNRLNTVDGTFHQYSARPGGINANSVGALLVASDSTVWVGSEGLNSYDPESDDFVRYTLDREAQMAGPAVNDITTIVEDGHGQLWIGTDAGGLLKYDQESGQFERFTADPQLSISLASQSVLSVMEDRSGVLWVGTSDGLNSVDLHAESFTMLTNERAEAFGNLVYEDASGTLWIGSRNDGLYGYSVASGRATHYRHNPLDRQSLSWDDVTALHQPPDDDQTLWVGTWGGGLNRLDIRSGSFRRYPISAAITSRALSSGVISSLETDPVYPEFLWIGTWGRGIDLLDTEVGVFEHYGVGAGSDSTLSGPNVARIVASDSLLWIAVDGGGLNVLNPETGKVRVYSHNPGDTTSISHNGVRVVYRSEADSTIFWIGTWSGGLNRFDTKTGKFEWFTERNSGLPSNVVNDITEDAEGTLWLATNAGVCRFDSESRSFVAYGDISGLATTAATVAVRRRSGELVFGGPGWVAILGAGLLAQNDQPPNVVLTDFRVSGESLVPGEGSPLSKPISETRQVILDHDQKDLAIDFVGLHFSAPAENTYRYQLEPYETTWHEGSVRTAIYTNLDPGRYTFRVNAANPDGVWGPQDIELAIHILPPWYRSTIAYIAYFFIFLFAVMVFDRVQRRRHIRLERERAREKELEQARELEAAYKELQATQTQLVHAEKMASLGQLTAGIAHEIKNPLNFVNNFSELSAEMIDEIQEMLGDDGKVSDDDVDEIKAILTDLKFNQNKISEHGKRADSIVRNMLEHSRESPGERKPTDVNALLEEYVGLAYHGMRAADADLVANIVKNYDKNLGDVSIIAQDFARVCLNLLNNAFYAVHEKASSTDEEGYEPTVTVTTEKSGGQAVVRIADNGIGIPDDVMDKIFVPFFTTKPTGSGTGLGLSLSYDIIVQGHGGALTVEKTPGGGATFVIKVPL